MFDKERTFAEVIRAQGAEFVGIQQWGSEGGLVLFTDPVSWTTLAVNELEFSPQAISQRLETSRRKFSSFPAPKNHIVDAAGFVGWWRPKP